MEQKVAWAPHTSSPLVTHMYEHTCTDTDCHTHIRTGTHTPHRQSHTNTPAELGWGRGEQCMLRGPCSPCLRTLASLGSAHPTPGASGLSWPSSPCPLSPNANDQGSRNRPCCPAVPAHPTGLLPPPFDSGHAWGPPAWPIHRQGSLPPPEPPWPAHPSSGTPGCPTGPPSSQRRHATVLPAVLQGCPGPSGPQPSPLPSTATAGSPSPLGPDPTPAHLSWLDSSRTEPSLAKTPHWALGAPRRGVKKALPSGLRSQPLTHRAGSQQGQARFCNAPQGLGWGAGSQWAPAVPV